MHKHFIWILISYYLFTQSTGISVTSFAQKEIDLFRAFYQLKDALQNLSVPNITITVSDGTPHCRQMQCKYFCSNGQAANIATDINEASLTMRTDCPIIDELCLYNYEFPNNKVSIGFLGEYTERVTSLYISSSNIIEIEDGAFANAIFKELHFENLQLGPLENTFLTNMSTHFTTLAIIQKNKPIFSIAADFLEPIKYKIKYLTLQIGISCIRNLTTNSLLNNLAYVDFSYNDLRDQLSYSTFSRLSVVEKLYLSHSNITTLPNYVFAGLLDTLEHLDISHNELTTLSKHTFTYNSIPNNLKIIANNNPWHCTCDLQENMFSIFGYDSDATIICETPIGYNGSSVFNPSICIQTTEIPGSPTVSPPTLETPATTDDDIETPKYTTTSPLSTSTIPESTVESSSNTKETEITIVTPPYYTPPAHVQMECQVLEGMNPETGSQEASVPHIKFKITQYPGVGVKVTIESNGLNESHGLIWFNRVTKQYYKMEINYNEYGLGCYSSLTNETLISDLLPDLTYTFCLVANDETTVSPFSCKSIHIGGNIEVKYAAWLTRDMQLTGISLLVFGIVMFVFAGILSIFLTLKHKPTLLKGSKRIAKTKNGKTGEIIVFPKDKSFEDFKNKEEMLAKRNSKSTTPSSSHHRHDSTCSVDSYQSYMNANLYEVIPAYLRLYETNIPKLSVSHEDSDDSEPDSYLPPLSTNNSSANLVRYAEIPHRTKRISNDPLPEVPNNQEPLSLPLSECPSTHSDHTASQHSVEYIITLDSQV